MTHAGPTTLPKIAAAFGDHARQIRRRIALSWGQHGMLTIEGGVSPDGTLDTTVRDLLQRAQACDMHAADESGAALLYTPLPRPRQPRGRARRLETANPHHARPPGGRHRPPPDDGAIILLPDPLSAHRRLAL